MKMTQIKAMAKILGLKIPLAMKKIEVIRSIQVREGNFPCFKTASVYCDQDKCLFRKDCLEA